MNDTFSLEEVLWAVDSLKQKKWVEQMLDMVKDRIFWGELTKENIDQFRRFARKFSSMYYLMKDKFADTYRDGGERYFEHLRAVVINVLELPNPNLDKVLIALAHDSIEDTDKTYEGLAEDYGYKVALAVLAISKEPWEKYVESEEGYKPKREAIAKQARNEAYFWHMRSFESMAVHIKNLSVEKWLTLTQEEINEITKNALDVKFADRIHNLTTQWDEGANMLSRHDTIESNADKTRRKVDETKEYFLEVAKATNPEAYRKLKEHILRLEIRMFWVCGRAKIVVGQ